MREHHGQSIRIGVVGISLLGGLLGGAWGGQSSPTATAVAPARSISGPGMYVRSLPKDKADYPALHASGKGDIEISGEGVARFSGDGTLWVDKSCSFSLDAATTYTKKADNTGWTLDQFRGTARITGDKLHLRGKGDRLMVTAEGRGTVTLGGEGGMFILIKDGNKLVSGIWDQKGVKEDFAKTGAEKTSKLPGVKSELGAVGVIPAIAPQMKVYKRRQLPSEGGQSTMAATTGTAAATPPTTGTAAGPK